MFHVFKDVYLDIDQAFTSLHYECIAISERWSDLVFVDPISQRVGRFNSMEEFAALCLDGKVDDIWSFLFNVAPQSKRFVVYLTPEIYQTLQIQYWKSIFKNPTADTVYELHKFFVQDRWFKSFLYDENPQQAARDAGLSLEILPRAKFDELYESLNVVPFLNTMSKDVVSFEYLLADYFRNPDTPHAPVLLGKVAKFTWTNFVQELEVLKADLLNGILDVNNVLPDTHQLDTSDPTSLFEHVKTNRYLSWMTDPHIHYNDPIYLENNYSAEIFKRLYEKVLTLWDAGSIEDMTELIDMIYNHEYAELLERDVQRNLGCVYAAGRFRMRTNQVFSSWIYRVKRSGDLSPLDAYTLS